MTKLSMLTAAALLAAVPAFAQTTTAPGSTTAPGAPAVQGGSPSTANSGPGSTGTVTPGSAAEQRSNNSAGAGNAEQPSRPVPNTGRGASGMGSGG